MYVQILFSMGTNLEFGILSSPSMSRCQSQDDQQHLLLILITHRSIMIVRQPGGRDKSNEGEFMADHKYLEILDTGHPPPSPLLYPFMILCYNCRIFYCQCRAALKTERI